MKLEEKIKKIQGPILILGGSGFVGANLFRMIYKYRSDVFATTQSYPAWRLEGYPEKNIIKVDLLVDSSLNGLLDSVAPRTVMNCVAYGAYSFEKDASLIYETNFVFTSNLLNQLAARDITCYLHAGSSSEYGDNASGPEEDQLPMPNSDYAVSKIACANLLHYYGKKRALPCANLRLYSVYGPLEDSSRLIPALVKEGLDGKYPAFVDGDISRDFIYIDDVCEVFVDIAISIEEDDYGESFNIGTGTKTTIAEAAEVARQVFGIGDTPVFSMEKRKWDVSDWFANTEKVRKRFKWSAQTHFRQGLELTTDWYRELEDKEAYHQASKKFELDTRHSISAIITCYKDAQAIPIMYERLTKVFRELKVDYEIIFVNDSSPDDSEEVIRGITANDRHVMGISHSRNFGSQAAFRSGMDIATKNSCVLLDGDLQDPPELIEQFYEKWRQGYDVVYGRRIKREASLLMRGAYKLFYRIFDYFSYLSIPHDAGDFSLVDKTVVQHILKCPERDFFFRGVRAYVGFKQAGVDYVRPERMFGKTTNSFLKNIGWAKKGILSFSYTPLNMLSFLGCSFMFIAIILGIVQVAVRLLFPEIAPKGLTTVLLVILFFGSINLLGIAILGEYIAKIFEEVKRRPPFIRSSIIKSGDIRDASIATANEK